MSSRNPDWSAAEKKIARTAYDTAVAAALARIMAELKRRAEVAKEPSDMWAIEDYLRDERRDIDEMFTYSYSKLPDVFAYAVRMGYIDESHLAGLAEDKLYMVRLVLSPSRG